jgi:hypothetical protein
MKNLAAIAHPPGPPPAALFFEFPRFATGITTAGRKFMKTFVEFVGIASDVLIGFTWPAGDSNDEEGSRGAC